MGIPFGIVDRSSPLHFTGRNDIRGHVRRHSRISVIDKVFGKKVMSKTVTTSIQPGEGVAVHGYSVLSLYI